MVNKNKNAGPYRGKKMKGKLLITMTLLLIIVTCPLFIFCDHDYQVDGNILVPTADGHRLHKGRFTFSSGSIKIECPEKIFKPLNQLKSPMKTTLVIGINDIIEVCPGKWYIFVRTTDSFYRKYRHLHVDVVGGSLWYGSYVEWNIILQMDSTDPLIGQDKNAVGAIRKLYGNKIRKDYR